jgi:hypothetical protein
MIDRPILLDAAISGFNAPLGMQSESQWRMEFGPFAFLLTHGPAGHLGVVIFALKLAEQELTGSLFGWWSVSPHDLKIPKQR